MKTAHRNRCPGCRRYFSTPQGLGLHFMWMRKNPKVCIARTARAGE